MKPAAMLHQPHSLVNFINKISISAILLKHTSKVNYSLTPLAFSKNIHTNVT